MRLVTFVVIAAVCWAGVCADFNECLGVEMAALLTKPSCMELFSTCQVGVNKLNQKLVSAESLKPVSIISASESKTVAKNSTKIAMIVQLAPIIDCLSASVMKIEDNSCKFDMAKVELYSILLEHEYGTSWKLEGYKSHSLSDDERAQIVEEYNRGQFYDSKLAFGIFDAPGLPVESNSEEVAPQSPVAVVAVSVLALFCLGVVIHQRRRLHNGYAPVYVTKAGHVQGKNSLMREAPEERSLCSANATGGQTFKQEPIERFAV